MGQRMESIGCLFGSGRANRGEVTLLYTGREGIFVHYVDDPSLNIFKLGGAVALFYEVISLNSMQQIYSKSHDCCSGPGIFQHSLDF
jgi:hypothetical protein